jgi:hypothetical protein
MAIRAPGGENDTSDQRESELPGADEVLRGEDHMILLLASLLVDTLLLFAANSI